PKGRRCKAAVSCRTPNNIHTMKLSFQEEYGLRCLLRVATLSDPNYLTINEISEDEGLSASYVAKLMRVLRQKGFVRSVRGQVGGYALARPAEEIIVG